MLHYKTEILLFCILPDFNLNHQLRVINENFFINRRNSLAKSRSTVGFKNQALIEAASFFIYATAVFLIVEVISII